MAAAVSHGLRPRGWGSDGQISAVTLDGCTRFYPICSAPPILGLVTNMSVRMTDFVMGAHQMKGGWYCGGCSRMSSSFGYLNKIGYKGFIFPIVIGESGSRYTDVSRPMIFWTSGYCKPCTRKISCMAHCKLHAATSNLSTANIALMTSLVRPSTFSPHDLLI